MCKEQSRHRLKNTLLDTVGEGEGRMALENSFQTYITVCKIACDSVMYEAGKAKPKLCDDLEG